MCVAGEDEKHPSLCTPVSTKVIDFWHYAIKAVPVGLSKGVKKLVQSKVPNLGRFEDVSDFITK
jgi:ribosome biogenesis protein SSF1/2